jgi:hypothetical protein
VVSSRRRSGRSQRIRLLEAVLAACLLASLALVASATATGPAPQQTAGKPICPPVKAGYARCHAWGRTNSAGQIAPNVAPSGYGPVQFQTAYGLTAAAAAPTSRIIAIVDAFDDPSAKSDLDTFNTTYGLAAFPTCSGSSNVGCFRKVNQNGGSTPPAVDGDWAVEISLDVQVAHALCPNCGILLVEADSNFDSDLYTAVDYAAAHANVVSNSWGGSEYQGQTSDDSHFNHPGVAITVSSGDFGFGVEYPSSSRYVTSVGGTTLTLNGNNTRLSETVWDGAGSGCSTMETKPSWQTDSGCSRRTVADVSADADPNTGAAIYDTTAPYNGWLQVGGTSLSAPLIASVYALAGVGGGSTYPASYPYSHSASLFDVVSGSNGFCNPNYLCHGASGYDGPTGLGTPIGTAAFVSSGSSQTPTISSFTPTSGPAASQVVITGTNFTNVTSVQIVKGANFKAATFTVNSPTQITATVPSGVPAGNAVNWKVTTSAGSVTSAGTFTITSGSGGGGGSGPTISSFSPSSGARGSQVTINGTNFSNVTSVQVVTSCCAGSATYTVNSSTKITATVPSAVPHGVSVRWKITTSAGSVTSTGLFAVT